MARSGPKSVRLLAEWTPTVVTDIEIIYKIVENARPVSFL